MFDIARVVWLFYLTVINMCLANPYDYCKEILRDGVRDTLSTNNTIDTQLATHNQFCSIAKSTDLNEQNFENFAKEYAKNASSGQNNYGGGFDLSIGPFKLGPNYGQTNNSSNLSEDEKERLLKINSKKIIDYYNLNCGQENYEESLKSEAVLMSKVANPDVVAAWRDCMVNLTGFFVDLVPSADDQGEDEIEYDMVLSYRSNEGTSINGVFLRYKEDVIITPYETIVEKGKYVRTVELCEYEKFTIKNGASYLLNFTHLDRKRSANIRVFAKTDAGVVKSQVLVLPRLAVPEPMDSSYFGVENYCDNDQCSQYGIVVGSERHEISAEFIRNVEQLNAGTCYGCQQLKNVRFCFRNCRYKFRGLRDLVKVETCEDIAREDFRYMYPFEDGREFYRKVRVVTGRINGPSIDKTVLIDI